MMVCQQFRIAHSPSPPIMRTLVQALVPEKTAEGTNCVGRVICDGILFFLESVLTLASRMLKVTLPAKAEGVSPPLGVLSAWEAASALAVT